MNDGPASPRLYPDRSGNLWIGATGVGVYRHDGDAFTLFDQTDRPDLNGGFGLQGMTEDRHGTLWFGFSGGLFRFDGKGIRARGPHGRGGGRHAWRIQAALTERYARSSQSPEGGDGAARRGAAAALG